jgi:type II secretory pathway pseudopilin PulG
MKNCERGQSLFELVVAIGISALIIVVLVSLVGNALQNAAFARNETLAGNYAQQATEWLRGQRDSDTNTFEMHVSSSFDVARCFNVLVWNGPVAACGLNETITDTPFVRQILFTSKNVLIDGVTKTIVEAEVTVSWTDSKGFHEVTNATDFSDWRQR